jgi:hypothetical protein
MVWQKAWGDNGSWDSTKYNWSGKQSQFNQQYGYNQGSGAYDIMKGLQSSPLGGGGQQQPQTSYGNQTYQGVGDDWYQKKMAMQGGGGQQQPGGYPWMQALQNSGPYAALQQQYGHRRKREPVRRADHLGRLALRAGHGAR